MKNCLYLGLLFISVFLCVGQSEQNRIQPKKSNFDYLILRQIWPASTCMFPGPNTCSIARNISTWVVHGLWYVFKRKAPFRLSDNLNNLIF